MTKDSVTMSTSQSFITGLTICNPSQTTVLPYYMFNFQKSYTYLQSINVSFIKEASFKSESKENSQFTLSRIMSTTVTGDAQSYEQVISYIKCNVNKVDALSNAGTIHNSLKSATMNISEVNMTSCVFKDNSFTFDLITYSSSSTISDTYMQNNVKGTQYRVTRGDATNRLPKLTCVVVTFPATPYRTPESTPRESPKETPSSTPGISPIETPVETPATTPHPSMSPVPTASLLPTDKIIIEIEKRKGLDAPAIAGITIGVLAFIGLIVSLAIFTWKKTRPIQVDNEDSLSEEYYSYEYESEQ